MSVDGRTRLGTNTELLLKLGTAALGTLYVFGILVSNVQLMEVGISDFTSLQVRNVMTGFLFVFYLVCLLLLLAPITMAFYLCLHVAIRPTLSFPQKLWRTLCNVVLMTLVAGGILYFLGTILGYFYPWGQEWITPFSQVSWEFQKAHILTAYAQSMDAFLHPKIIAAGFMFMFSLFYPISRLARSRELLPDDEEAHVETPGRMFVSVLERDLFSGGLAISYALLGIAFSLVGFSQEVYPNMRYNFGGGQPDVAKLQIGAEKSAKITLPGIAMCCETDQPNFLVVTDPVVIWYQSDKFLYATPLNEDARAEARLIALDIKMIRTIQYLPQAVRVGSGARVLSVYSAHK